MAYQRPKSHFTPVGVAEPYCWLQKPDYGNENFKQPRGVYKVDLTVPADDPKTRQLMAEIERIHAENYARLEQEYAENPPKVQRGKKPLEPYEGDMPFFENDDGTVTFKFKCYASYQDRKTQETKQINLSVVDSKGKVIRDVPNIAGGSELKVKFSMIPYGYTAVAGASVKLQLEGIMLINLREFGAGGADDWGDEVEEDGFVATEEQRQGRQSQKEDDWDESESESAEDYSDGDF